MIVNKKSFNYRLTHFFFGASGVDIPASKYLDSLIGSYIILLIIIVCLLPLPIVIMFKIDNEFMLTSMVISSMCWVVFIMYLIVSLLIHLSKKIKSIKVTYED